MTAVTARTGPPVAAARPTPPAGPAHEGELPEIGQISVHLAALERTVLPAAAAIGHGGAQVEELRRHGRELAKALHWLDRHLTGDARMANWPTDQLSDAVRIAAANHARSERAVVDTLAPALSDREIVELGESYHRTALAAPTRPHPWLSFRGSAGRVAFKLAARIDAIRDGLDNLSSDDIRASAAKAVRHRDIC